MTRTLYGTEQIFFRIFVLNLHLFKTMSTYGPSDPAWEEYMTTGIDPTGGDLGSDFDPATGLPLDDYQEDEPEQWQEETEEECYDDSLPEWAILPSRLPDRILFIDTETDGLPVEYAGNGQLYPGEWPHIVQIAWIMADDEGHTLSSGSRIIKPEGFIIPDEAAAIHGITTERALQEGQPRKQVMRKVQDLLGKVNFIVAHNLVFDANVVAAEMARCGIHTDILYYNAFCTMVGTTDLCKLPFPDGMTHYGKYKWPKLSELHEFLFGETFTGAHDALADVKATARCFWRLMRNS